MKKVFLSFDIEEFDMPLEYGVNISFEEQIRISTEGTQIILDILKEHKIKATFFSTVIFAHAASHLIKRIITEGHELASHGYYHSKFSEKDLLESRRELEKLSGRPILGFRMPRMKPVSDSAIRTAGYQYNSSLNPIYLPGRYNNFFASRTRFEKEGVTQLPASATPLLRIPLFWLSFHNFPLWFYKLCCQRTINKDKSLNIYFHPWEFMDISSGYNFPSYVYRNSGKKMEERFYTWVVWMRKRGYDFGLLKEII